MSDSSFGKMLHMVTELGVTNAFNACPVLWLQVPKEAEIFCDILVRRVASFIKKQQVIIDASRTNSADIKTTGSVSFLGESLFYWIKEFEALSDNDRISLCEYIAYYTGPHKLVCSIESSYKIYDKNSVLISIPEYITSSDFQAFFLFVHGQMINERDNFVRSIFDRHSKITLNDACRIARYKIVIGKHSEQFCEKWLERILPIDRSLFDLSQFFFAKDVRAFIKHWQSLSEIYSQEFWTNYWSDQLWQAALFIQNIQASGHSSQPRTFRLPFSFMQRDWKRYTISELSRAHWWLYDVDYRQKNSCSTGGIDLFCMKFVTNCFK